MLIQIFYHNMDTVFFLYQLQIFNHFSHCQGKIKKYKFGILNAKFAILIRYHGEPYFGSPLVWCVSDFVKIYEKGNDQKLSERLQIINLQNFCCDEAYTLEL